jgi:hypothetical protein
MAGGNKTPPLHAFTTMNSRNAISILLGLISLVILFHLAIIVRIIPYTIAWGGRLKSDNEMYIFEVLSIVVNIFLAVVLLMKGKYIKSFLAERGVNIILRIFFSLFILNTIGNFLAKTNFEKFFSIVTLLFAVLIWIVLRSRQTHERKAT